MASTSATPRTPAEPSAGSFVAALRAGPVLLDGGLATELERAGHDLSGALWSAELLRAAPQAVVAAHRAFFAAGARVATTASYQASLPGFATVGLDADQARDLLRRSVRLAREAADGVAGRWVAASVGPYGATLAGGQEYTGEYAGPGGLTVEELRAFHRPRLATLIEAGPDLIGCETLPAAAEADALLAELSGLGVPAWLSLTTVIGPDGVVRTRLGEPAERVFAAAGEVAEVVAVGVNCTDPAGVEAAVRLAATASGKPVVVYPNSGERWDPVARHWTGRPGFAAEDVAGWLAAGARLIGGCCRVGPADIARLGSEIRTLAAQLPVEPAGAAQERGSSGRGAAAGGGQ